MKDPYKVPRSARHHSMRWILKILHDPKYLIHWELWYYSILRSCRILSINSSGISCHIVGSSQAQGWEV